MHTTHTPHTHNTPTCTPHAHHTHTTHTHHTRAEAPHALHISSQWAADNDNACDHACGEAGGCWRWQLRFLTTRGSEAVGNSDVWGFTPLRVSTCLLSGQ